MGFCATSQKSISYLSLASRQERRQICPSESIVTYPQGSARRVRSVRRVLECRCVISLQATSHLPLPLELLMYGYFCVCFAVEVRETCFWVDIKTVGNGFLTLP